METSLEKLERFTGLTSFLAVYKWLHGMGKLQSRELTLKRPSRNVTLFGKPVTVQESQLRINPDDIKKAAMAEVFKALPTRDEITKIACCLGGNPPQWKRQEALEILNKIPTK